MYGKGIFSADIYQTFGSSDSVTADCHSLDDAVGVTFENGTIHESTGVALVGIADDIFLVGFVLSAEFPFQTCGETSAATTTET